MVINQMESKNAKVKKVKVKVKLKLNFVASFVYRIDKIPAIFF